MTNTQNITLDLTNPHLSPPPTVYAKQGDSGSRTVVTKIIDNGNDVTTTAPCRVYFSGIGGGSPCYITGTVTNGTVTFTIPQTATKKSGTVKAEVQILNSDNSKEVIATMNFDLVVKQTAYNVGAIVGESGVNLADQYVDDAVSTHNASDKAHSDIRDKIVADLSDHNTNGDSHKNIQDDLKKYSDDADTETLTAAKEYADEKVADKIPYYRLEPDVTSGSNISGTVAYRGINGITTADYSFSADGKSDGTYYLAASATGVSETVIGIIKIKPTSGLVILAYVTVTSGVFSDFRLVGDRYLQNALSDHNTKGESHKNIQRDLKTYANDKDAETLTAAKEYANIKADEAYNALSDHNTSATAHENIRTSISTLRDTVDDIKAYLGYTDEDIAGICVDYQNKTFKRLAGAYDKQAGTDFDVFAMFGGRKRCNVSDDGTIVAYYGDEDYAEDGSMGQVMVYQPAFYYKIVPLVYDKNTETGIGYHLRKANYYVSTRPKTGFKLHPAFYDANGNAVDYILLSAYEGSMYDVSGSVYVNDGVDTDTAIETGDLLCSIAGKKPISGLKKNLTKANLELMAQNRGSNWHLENVKATSANQLLMIIELGTMNTQTAIGQGVVSISDNSAYNCSSLTGSTAALGNGTGQATETTNEIGGTETAYTTSGKLAVTYRGVENPWGNIWKHIQGINIWGNGSMGGGQPYVADGFTYNESKNTDPYHPVGFTLANANGYVNAMGYGSEEYDWLLMPSEIGGTSALPVGDYTYVTANLNGYRIALLGGNWIYGGYAGGFFWACNYGVGYRGRNVGGRLVYVPTATV